jgi:hypothetical protein
MIFLFDDLCIDDGRVLKSPTTTVFESICAFKSFKLCLMKLAALTLGAYRLILVISFWCISPFISINYPSLSCLINVSLKSIGLKQVLPLLPVFGGIGFVNLLPVFTLSQCLFLSMR